MNAPKWPSSQSFSLLSGLPVRRSTSDQSIIVDLRYWADVKQLLGLRVVKLAWGKGDQRPNLIVEEEK